AQPRVCEDIGDQVLACGQRVSPEEWTAKINAIGAKTLRIVCSKYIYDKCPAVAADGLVKQLPDYDTIRSAMCWLRF
ncbi:unnamed protein product, partial [Staurois parvus]